MIKFYKLNESDLYLNSDIAGKTPLYLYYSESKKQVVYCDNIVKLLESKHVKKPLDISPEGISFLLQSSVVPPPRTIYKNIFLLSAGDYVQIKTRNNQIKLSFKHEYPFHNAFRNKSADVNENEILELLEGALKGEINNEHRSFLFHSAGKDSNTIAIALAEFGWQDQVVLVNQQSKGDKDENFISKNVAQKLGFKHQTLHEITRLEKSHYKWIDDYFYKSPFPTVDNVTIAYPLFAYQFPDLIESNIIFGDGNDSYMMTPPDKREKLKFSFVHWTSKLRKFNFDIESENYFNSILKTQAEIFGKSGFSFSDTRRIFPEAISVYEHWEEESLLRREWDIVDFKTDIYSTITITERMIRKLYNFGDVYDSNVILPFTNESVVKYFKNMPEKYLFDRRENKNKLILRKILKDNLDLDSDEIGKMGWEFDSIEIVLRNWTYISEEILKCKYWNHENTNHIINRLKKSMQLDIKYNELAGRLIYRIYLLSKWINHNKYVN